MTEFFSSHPLPVVEKLPLNGPRLTLTAYNKEDLATLLPFFQDVSTLRYYLPTTVRPFNLEQLDLLLSDWNDGQSNFVFAIRHEGQICGLVNLDGLDFPNSHAEIGIAITSKLQRGQGFASEALALLLDFAFGELNLQRIWCRIISGNDPSVRLFTRLGFVQEGVLRQHVRRSGEFRDMLVYGLLHNEYMAPKSL
ncbi:MAG: N-acetyltransferase [Clostridia bacterium]|nr:N-acetyltransferase [Clostridia bacterium]NCC74872.1 N-acetyltransferase [Clostridia bacterium]